MGLDAALADLDVCDLTTTGRVSWRARTVELWFALEGSTVYLLAGGGDRADWVRNLRRDGRVLVRLGDAEWRGTAHIPRPGTTEDAHARELVAGKYERR